MAANRIAFLYTLELSLGLRIQSNNSVILQITESFQVNVIVTRLNNMLSILSLDQYELSAVGIVDSGLQVLIYIAKPQRFNMNETSRLTLLTSMLIQKP